MFYDLCNLHIWSAVTRLNFSTHVKYISNKISKSIGILFKLKHFLPVHILKLLYFTLVQPYISYGIEAWFATSTNVTNKIFVQQKRACRAIHNLDYNSHTSAYFKKMNALRLPDLYRYQLLTYVFRTILNNNYDTDLSNKLMYISDSHSYPTRHSNTFVVPSFKKSKSQNCIQYKGITLFNNLPSNIINCDHTLPKFKRELKSYYLSFY